MINNMVNVSPEWVIFVTLLQISVLNKGADWDNIINLSLLVAQTFPAPRTVCCKMILEVNTPRTISKLPLCQTVHWKYKSWHLFSITESAKALPRNLKTMMNFLLSLQLNTLLHLGKYECSLFIALAQPSEVNANSGTFVLLYPQVNKQQTQCIGCWFNDTCWHVLWLFLLALCQGLQLLASITAV